MALHRWIRHDAKVPRRVYGGNASTTDPKSWASYESARASSVGDGIGFVFAADGIAGIDLDHCLTNGRLVGWAAPIVKQARGTYIEISPSGTGLHIFGFGVVGAGRKIGHVEVYDRARYFTVTGHRFKRAPLALANIQPLIDSLI
jgi:primase-polymerase (primpol)-like protein